MSQSIDTSTPMTARSTTKRGLSWAGIVSSEWIKLTTLRSTAWCYAILVVLSVAAALLLAISYFSPEPLDAESQQSVWVLAATIGVGAVALIVAVLGVLVIAGEYSTGMIRSTLTSVPDRLSALAAKAFVIALATFVVGLVTITLSGLIAAIVFPIGGVVSPDFGDTKVWLAFLGAAGYLSLLSVIALAIGAITRNSAGGIATALGLILVLPTVVQVIAFSTRVEWLANVLNFLPSSAGERMYSYSVGDAAAAGIDPSVITLDPGQGTLIVALWALVLLLIAGVLLKRRDV